jgi:hypothetical protein
VGGSSADVVRLLNDDQIADTAAMTIGNSGLFDLNGFHDFLLIPFFGEK